MLSDRLFASFNVNAPGGSLADLSISLLEQQKNTWPQLADGYKALELVKVREIHCNGFSVRLQLNSKRIASTSANVDEKSVRGRKCFLCLENLPDEQKGILYGDDFLVLCNPAPIFSQHYTITNVQHIPQALVGFIGTFLSLAKDVSPNFNIFYNGSQCGASAPDYMHFQAGPYGAIPVERDAEDAQRRVLKKKTRAVSFLTLQSYGRQVIVLESKDKRELEYCILRLLETMKGVAFAAEEPMINILCSFRQTSWRVIVFPRRKHRPDVYFWEGEARVLISPAAVDIGGLVITPVEKDFHRVDAKLIENIFEEVSVNEDVLEKIIGAI